MLLIIAALSFAFLPMLAEAQLLADPGNSPSIVAGPATQPSLAYTRPTAKAKLHNYVFDAPDPGANP